MKLPIRDSAGYAPLRRANSVRRTSSIDVSWPDGHAGNMRFDARARDIYTPSNSSDVQVLAEDAFIASVNQERTIESIATFPERSNTALLVGERGGGHLRKVLGTLLPDELANCTPLYLILDDISGTSLISGWAWSHWTPDWLEQVKAAQAERQIRMEGVCIGFSPGSSALDAFSPGRTMEPAPTPELRHPDDLLGWHEFTEQASVGMRRARRIDVWLDGDVIHIEAAFQDSGTVPDIDMATVSGDALHAKASEERMALHEYIIRAEADVNSGQIKQLVAEPRVLPFPECHGAPGNMSRLVNTALRDLRGTVLDELSATAGCTHLNDALRALAEVPHLANYLLDRR